ncbi:MAG: serine hydrolase domain-containing protein [Candidatus Margulisiibacteriota bacterium]
MLHKLFWLGLVLFFIGLVSSCGTTISQNNQYQTELNTMLTDKWASYGADKPNFGGGLAIYITSPKGNFYASTDMPDGTKDTHFRAASTTKTFTSAAIMLLSEQGKLEIDDYITDLIPGSSEPYVPSTDEYNIPNKSQITIKMLLKHRAGVFDVTNELIPSTEAVPYAGQCYPLYVFATYGMEHLFTYDELVSVDATCNLSYFLPDAGYHYSNTGYNILGKIIERVSGQRYDQFVNENFVVTNNLTETTFPYLGEYVYPPSPYVVGYKYENQALTEATRDNMSMNVAEGNIITTPVNLTNWIKRLINGQAGLSADTIFLMTSEAANANGYGLGIAKVSGLGYGHNGQHGGYLTSVYSDPSQDVTVVIFASVVNEDDVVGELLCLIQAGWAAKNILGYSTAEAF